MRVMIIDIGSNTVKYDLFSVKDRRVRKKEHGSRPIRLFGKISEGKLTDEGMELLCGTLNAYKERAKEQDCALISAFATASMRKLSQPETALREVKKRTGLDVRLLSGEEEAQCSFYGMLATLKKPPLRGVMLDMGGGSTELNFFEDQNSLWLHSCPFGVVSAKLTLGLGMTLTEEEKARVADYAVSFLPEKTASFPANSGKAVLIGGTAKAIAKLAKTFLDVKDPEKLKIDDFLDLRDLLCKADEDQQKLTALICPDRYELMAIGMTAFSAIFERIGTKKVYICKGGIRDGYLRKLMRETDLLSGN